MTDETSNDHRNQHAHAHGHEHDHDPLEEGAALRVRALEELMVAKGLVNPKAVPGEFVTNG